MTDVQIGPRGHKILGDLATAYIDTQLCEVKKRGQEGWTVADYHVEPMPRVSRSPFESQSPSLIVASTHGPLRQRCRDPATGTNLLVHQRQGQGSP